ncbi:AAA family ATPase [Actinomadura rifamycini]|uniref:AAA family ATPase n=1 Tax=Actinomadura rifamycini TaxID=31962 RepID=UPI00042031CF|nr:AAA family ATPase [Actinomadura rifamycini]
MVEVAVLIGLQASGKTTFYRARLAATHVHVSKDLFPRARRKQARQMRLVAAALEAGRDVAVDNTNPSPDEWAPLIGAARRFGARAVGYWFPPDVALSMRRNALRPPEIRVPDVGVYATLKRLRRPGPGDGFDELWTVRPDGRGVEKLVSLSAGIASAAFTQAAGEYAVFDSRVWTGTGPDDVVDYLSWRQADAARCALNGWSYWTLRKEGRSPRQASRELFRASVSDKNELLFARGINFNDVPAWQRRGVGLWWETFEKAGRDPVADVAVTATRRRVRVERELPMRDEYRAFVRDLLSR